MADTDLEAYQRSEIKEGYDDRNYRCYSDSSGRDSGDYIRIRIRIVKDSEVKEMREKTAGKSEFC